MLEAKSTLSKLVDRLERGQDREILIARRGKPVARLTLVGLRSVKKRIGVARGKFVVPGDIDADNEEIGQSFVGSDP
ncbi:MAG: prevent-host-death protein [Deltaproteobacteria bacterium]|nr:prevent-host-death protein [Deltaproteobacteria bacterium]